MTASTPKRRKSDRGWRSLVRDNWYRDVWLFIVSALLLWSLATIQNERWANVRRGCEADNTHYVAAMRELNELYDGIPKSQQARARASRDSTIALISTLAPPHFDARGRSTCKQIADRQVSRWP